MWACVALLVACLMEEPEVPGSIPGPAHTIVEMDHKIFSFVISPAFFHLFNKGSCQLLEKVWALGTG